VNYLDSSRKLLMIIIFWHLAVSRADVLIQQFSKINISLTIAVNCKLVEDFSTYFNVLYLQMKSEVADALHLVYLSKIIVHYYPVPST